MDPVAPYQIHEVNRHEANSAMFEQVLKDEYQARLAWVYSGFWFVMTVLYGVILWLLPHVTTYVPELVFAFWRGDFLGLSNVVWFIPGYITLATALLFLLRTKNESLNFYLKHMDILGGSYLHDYNKTKTTIRTLVTLLATALFLFVMYIFFVKDHI